MPPPKKAPGKLASGAGRYLLTRVEHHLLRFMLRPLGFLFWRVQQRNGRLQDRLANIEASES